MILDATFLDNYLYNIELTAAITITIIVAIGTLIDLKTIEAAGIFSLLFLALFSIDKSMYRPDAKRIYISSTIGDEVEKPIKELKSLSGNFIFPLNKEGIIKIPEWIEFKLSCDDIESKYKIHYQNYPNKLFSTSIFNKSPIILKGQSVLWKLFIKGNYNENTYQDKGRYSHITHKSLLDCSNLDKFKKSIVFN